MLAGKRDSKPAASRTNCDMREEDFPKGYVPMSEQEFEAERQKQLAALEAMRGGANRGNK